MYRIRKKQEDRKKVQNFILKFKTPDFSNVLHRAVGCLAWSRPEMASTTDNILKKGKIKKKNKKDPWRVGVGVPGYNNVLH